jgi:hypothetical protein
MRRMRRRSLPHFVNMKMLVYHVVGLSTIFMGK